MKLLEINRAILDVLEKGFTTSDETGEIFETEDLDALEMAFEDKIDGIAYYIKNEETMIQQLKEESKSLAQRAKYHEGHVNWMKRYVLNALLARDMTKLETVKNNITTRKSTYVDIKDEEDLPRKYLTKTVSLKPDRKAIKEVLDSGKKVRGAELAERVNIYFK